MIQSPESVREKDFRCLFPVDESKLIHGESDYWRDYTEGGLDFKSGRNNPENGDFSICILLLKNRGNRIGNH